MLSVLRKLVPAGMRHALRRAWDDRQLRMAIGPLRRRGELTADEILTFRKAWGNEGFSADERYLAETIRIIKANGGPVLECGTGATTILAGVLAELHGFDVYSLEQDAEWAVSVRRSIRLNQLSRVKIIDAALKNHGDYYWYDMTGINLPKKFGVVLCDAPYIAEELGEPYFANWRYGVLPYCHASGTRFDALLLDDVNVDRALPVMKRWQQEFGVSQDVISAAEGDCAVIRQKS